MGNFRATGIGLHSRDSHTLKCSDSALGKNPAIFLMAYVREATVLKFGKLPKEGKGERGGVFSDPNNFAADFCSNFCNSGILEGGGHSQTQKQILKPKQVLETLRTEKLWSQN